MPASAAQRAAAAEKRAKAVSLRVAGADWQTIADTLGYASRGAACATVGRALQQSNHEANWGADQLRQIELARLDRLQRAMWQQAIQGDPRSADTALKIIDRRIKLMGLDMVPEQLDEQLRRDLAMQAAQQMYAVFGRILDGLHLTAEQRALVPALIEDAIRAFLGQPKVIEGQVQATPTLRPVGLARLAFADDNNGGGPH
jgi:hypothetical protein